MRLWTEACFEINALSAAAICYILFIKGRSGSGSPVFYFNQKAKQRINAFDGWIQFIKTINSQ